MNASLSSSLLAAAAAHSGGWLTGKLLNIAKTGAEWVLWLLVFLGVIAAVITIERFFFYRKHKADAAALRQLVINLDGGNIDAAIASLKGASAGMEVNVLAYGMSQLDKGGRAVEELMAGALTREKGRYDRGLWYLATLGNNAPFIGLFGTVLGVIQAFDAMGGDSGGSSAAVMGPIAEALIATGVGLLVAIPAVVAFNTYKQTVKAVTSNTELLMRTLVAHMFSEEDVPEHAQAKSH